MAEEIMETAHQIATALLDAETPKEFMKRRGPDLVNTLLSYEYRDASNYKSFSQVVLSGYAGGMVKFMVCAPADADPGTFLPGQVGLEPLQKNMKGFPSDDDHVFHHLLAIQRTKQAPTEKLTSAQLLANFKEAAATGWDIPAEMRRAGLLESESPKDFFKRKGILSKRLMSPHAKATEELIYWLRNGSADGGPFVKPTEVINARPELDVNWYTGHLDANGNAMWEINVFDPDTKAYVEAPLDLDGEIIWEDWKSVDFK